MSRQAPLSPLPGLRAWLVALLLLSGTQAGAHEPVETIPDPGFRPPSELATAFLADVGDTSVAVLPSVVRRIDRTAQSFASQRQVIDFLNASGIAQASPASGRIDLGPLGPGSQWEYFQAGLAAAAGVAAEAKVAADYVMVMEFIVPGDQEVFGIEVYILDRQGRNAFSFLLNSHHQLFAAAGLTASGTSEAARSRMIEDATHAGLTALATQVEAARQCARRERAAVPRATAGPLHDFDGALTSGADPSGMLLGYSTFNGPDSTVSFATTGSYPPRAGVAAGNRVLQLDLDVTSWGGIVNRFTNEAVDRWTAQDWRSLGGLSFWFLGANSGAEMFFDIFDNRHPCSTTDDAERFRYRFRDDTAGWRLIEVHFADLKREDIGNDAPDDGLGLERVHGWGLGTSATGGPVRLWMDDLRLLPGQ